jgi:hypothetical protein
VCQHEISQEKVNRSSDKIINSMPYVLLLLFEYQRYKKDAVIRIYADNILVDEISLTKDIKLKTKPEPLYRTPSNTPPEQFYTDNYTRIMFVPEKLFLFEISEKYLNHNIRIEVKNDNNNYTNGFMTKYSFVKFHRILLVPKCFLQYSTWNLLDRFRVDENDEGNFWPQTRTELNKNISESWKNHFLYFEKGGSFELTFPIFYKYKIAHLGKVPLGRLRLDIVVAKILDSFNAINTST